MKNRTTMFGPLLWQVAMCSAMIFATMGVVNCQAENSSATYRPPSRGAPASTISGGTRGIRPTDALLLRVIAPDHLALTTEASPTLYWFVSKPVSGTLELTIANDEDIEPLVQLKVTSASDGRLQPIRLHDLGVKLTPDTEYEWSVAVVVDPDSRSNDIIASGAIAYRLPSSDLVRRLAQAESQRYRIFAEEGYWYDAIGGLENALQAASSTDRVHLVSDRAALLRQIKLEDVASALEKSQ